MFGNFFSNPFIVGPGTLTVALFVAATSLRDFFYPPPEVGKFTEEWWDNVRIEQALYSSDEEDFQAAVERQKQDVELHPNLKRWRESVPTTYI